MADSHDSRTITFRIDFPALDNLVAYLRENGTLQTQQQIDAITDQVRQVTAQLKQSATRLQDDVDTTKGA